MKPVKHKFHADRKTKSYRLDQHMRNHVRRYKKMLRDLHPTARNIAHKIIEQSIDNRTWLVEFYVN